MIEKTARKNLLRIAAVYARATGVSLSAVSREVYGKGNFLEDFRKGRQGISLGKITEVLRFFGRNWPEGTEWPQTEPLSMARPELGKKPRDVVENRPSL